jgi:octaprenyl-diphosphate synthase
MDREYTGELQKIEASLQEALPNNPGASWWDAVFPGLRPGPELASALLEPVRDLLNRGGKRWRPLLAHLACRAMGGGDAALPLLALVEFSHNASLIHDDLEDNSPERRGKKTLHLLYGSDTAINSGSFLYFLSLMVLEQWNGGAETKLALQKLWGSHLRLLHLGQSMDIAWHRDSSCIPTPEDYMLMCGLKTGCLARFAVLLGAEVAGAAAAETAPLGEAAQKLGVGFQILDDVKNLSTGIPGKTQGDDVVEGKKSLPVLLFLRENTSRIDLVQRCFNAAKEGGAGVPEVKELIGAIREAGALAEAEKQGKALIAQAAALFDSLPAKDMTAKTLLMNLTERLL